MIHKCEMPKQPCSCHACDVPHKCCYTPKPKARVDNGFYFFNGISIPDSAGFVIPVCQAHVRENPMKPKEVKCVRCTTFMGPLGDCSCAPPLPAEVEKAIEKAADQIWFGPLISHSGLSPILRALAHLARKAR